MGSQHRVPPLPTKVFLSFHNRWEPFQLLQRWLRPFNWLKGQSNDWLKHTEPNLEWKGALASASWWGSVVWNPWFHCFFRVCFQLLISCYIPFHALEFGHRGSQMTQAWNDLQPRIWFAPQLHRFLPFDQNTGFEFGCWCRAFLGQGAFSPRLLQVFVVVFCWDPFSSKSPEKWKEFVTFCSYCIDPGARCNNQCTTRRANELSQPGGTPHPHWCLYCVNLATYLRCIRLAAGRDALPWESWWQSLMHWRLLVVIYWFDALNFHISSRPDF